MKRGRTFTELRPLPSTGVFGQMKNEHRKVERSFVIFVVWAPRSSVRFSNTLYNISMVYQWKVWKKSALGKPARDFGDLGALGVGVRGIRFRYVIRITQHTAKVYGEHKIFWNLRTWLLTHASYSTWPNNLSVVLAYAQNVLTKTLTGGRDPCSPPRS